MKLAKKLLVAALALGFTVALAACGETYTVTFDSAGGSAVKAAKVEEEKKAKAPTAPEKQGYVFDGWLLDGEAYDFTKPITGDLTLVAKWKAAKDTPYTVLVYAEQTDGTYKEITSSFPQIVGLTGETDTEIEVDYLRVQGWGISSYATANGYRVNLKHKDGVKSGTIAADGSLVLKVYLDLNE